MGAVSNTKGFYDEPYRAPPEGGSIEDLRRALDQTSRRLDIAMNRLNRLEAKKRVTATATLTVNDRHVFADTDGGAITLTLPPGEDGLVLRIVNVGSSGNDVTVDGDGSETVQGSATVAVTDGNSLFIVYDSTEGWY